MIPWVRYLISKKGWLSCCLYGSRWALSWCAAVFFYSFYVKAEQKFNIWVELFSKEETRVPRQTQGEQTPQRKGSSSCEVTVLAFHHACNVKFNWLILQQCDRNTVHLSPFFVRVSSRFDTGPLNIWAPVHCLIPFSLFNIDDCVPMYNTNTIERLISSLTTTNWLTEEK